MNEELRDRGKGIQK